MCGRYYKSNYFFWNFSRFVLYLRYNILINHTMKAFLLSLTICSSLAIGAKAQVERVNPVPHSVTSSRHLFAAPKIWSVTADRQRLTSYAVATLSDLNVKKATKSAPFRITLGVVGDRSVNKFKKLVPQHEEGYYMAVGPKGVVIAGRDERGLYYGVQTLRDMMSKGQLETCTIQDWPDVKFRGAIEGFYGRPWSHEHRLRQIDFYGRNKMNVYIYGPKDDPYHRQHWREAYPEQEAKLLQELNVRAHQRGVNFYWAIHPGLDIKWTNEDRDNLVNKLEKMYGLGIRSFAVFFDDISGEGSRAEKQAELLNYVDSAFVRKHGDVSPLLLCPTIYNRAWSGKGNVYLHTLGQHLRPGIEVMWTGNSVVHTIEKEGMNWINERIRRKGYIWFNFPVNDFVRDHLLLGPTYGNGLDIADDLSGFVSNPMQYAESSKISLYSLADYLWNMKPYDAMSSWKRAIEDLLPAQSEALQVFASYNEDLGPNGHGFRRDESRDLKTLCDQAMKGDLSTATQLREHAQSLATSCDILMTDKTNPWLIEELQPWLMQGKLLAQYGETVTNLAELVAKDQDKNGDNGAPLMGFDAQYQRARALQKQMYDLEANRNVLHEYQTGIKLGTLRFLPALNKLFAVATEKMNAQAGTHYEVVTQYKPFTIDTDVPQLKLQPISIYGSEVKVAPSHEIITWPVGSHFTLTTDRPVTLRGMDFNFGKTGTAPLFQLECLRPDGSWQKVELLHYNDKDQVIHTGNELGGMAVRAIRITNISGAEQQLNFRHFKFVKD